MQEGAAPIVAAAGRVWGKNLAVAAGANQSSAIVTSTAAVYAIPIIAQEMLGVVIVFPSWVPADHP